MWGSESKGWSVWCRRQYAMTNSDALKLFHRHNWNVCVVFCHGATWWAAVMRDRTWTRTSSRLQLCSDFTAALNKAQRCSEDAFQMDLFDFRQAAASIFESKGDSVSCGQFVPVSLKTYGRQCHYVICVMVCSLTVIIFGIMEFLTTMGTFICCCCVCDVSVVVLLSRTSIIQPVQNSQTSQTCFWRSVEILWPCEVQS